MAQKTALHLHLRLLIARVVVSFLVLACEHGSYGRAAPQDLAVTVVVPCTSNTTVEDLSWLAGYRHMVYHRDDTESSFRSDVIRVEDSISDDGFLKMAFMTYIIDNYENLTELTVFTPYIFDWGPSYTRKNFLTDLEDIANGSITFTEENDGFMYFQPNCISLWEDLSTLTDWFTSAYTDDPVRLFKQFFLELLDIDHSTLRAFQWAPSDSFVVHRANILRRPKEYYKRLFGFLLYRREDPPVLLFFTRVWPLIFGSSCSSDENYHCHYVANTTCSCQHFRPWLEPSECPGPGESVNITAIAAGPITSARSDGPIVVWLKGEPKSGTTLMEFATYSAIEEVTGTKPNLHDRELGVPVAWSSQQDEGHNREMGFTLKYKHGIPCFNEGTEDGYSHSLALPEQSGPLGICDVCKGEDMDCYKRELMTEIQNAVVYTTYNEPLPVRYYEIIRDPRDVTLSRCYHETRNLSPQELSECARAMHCTTTLWVKWRELVVPFHSSLAGPPQQYETKILCYEGLLEYAGNEENRERSWKNYLEVVLELEMTEEQMRSFMKTLHPTHTMDRVLDMGSFGTTAGSVDYREKLRDFPEVVVEMTELYLAMESIAPSPCAGARANYYGRSMDSSPVFVHGSTGLES